MPPAVMTQLRSAYPGSNLFLLDGSPIVKDVVWDRAGGATTFSTNPWRTTLVAGFGPQQPGYYAVDVTNPKFQQTSGTPSDTPALADPGGPVFLWQMTKMPATNMPLFGQHSATPAVAQVAINGPRGVHRRGGAILPGGWDKTAHAHAARNRLVARRH